MRILVTGLPGSGKSYLSKMLNDQIPDSRLLNADALRTEHNDWDFNIEGRIRQAERMRRLADLNHKNVTIADFVAPTDELRAIYDPHYTFYMDTIKESRFEDTNRLYQPPTNPDATITNQEWDEFDVNEWVRRMYRELPTGVMIGRYQPFHDGHRALAERVLQKHPVLAILVRTVPRSDKNPFSFTEVQSRILTKMIDYRGRVQVIPCLNVGGVYYGRDVGYNVEQIELPPEIQAISATKIRQEMNKEH
jgi:cytidyltransferase-like protein